MVDNHGGHRHNSKSKSNSSTSSNVVGVHYRVGKKIGEGSFGVIYEGMYWEWLGGFHHADEFPYTLGPPPAT
jgi:casein kinase 1